MSEARPALRTIEDRIAPVRGLVLAHNRRGKAFPAVDVERWFRLARTVYKTEKTDLLLNGEPPANLASYFDTARDLDLRLSLRMDAGMSPADLGQLDAAGLFDLFITGTGMETVSLGPWLDMAQSAGLPLRIQLRAPFPADLDIAWLVERFLESGVVTVNLAAYDPFALETSRSSQDESEISLGVMQRLAEKLERAGMEANLLRTPFCIVREDAWPQVVNRPQLYLDHQQYESRGYRLAQQLYRRNTIAGGKAIQILLGRHTLFDDPIDRRLLPWILDAPWTRARVVAWHRLTRHRRLLRGVPKPESDDPESYERAVHEKLEREQRRAGPMCGRCRLQFICDQDSPELRRAMPGLTLQYQEGERLTDPMRFARQQPKYYDPIDSARLAQPESSIQLAARANDILLNTPPEREIDSQTYRIEGEWCHQLPGGVRWFGFSNSEKVSTPLAQLRPPFTLSAVFGGGIAEYAGFALGRDCRLLTRMAGYRHQIALHVEHDGRYVLLRDGKPVRPVRFEGRFYVPQRLGDVLEPRLVTWNVDNTLVTQNVTVWQGDADRPGPAAKKRLSIVTVCVRYARRLEASLQCVAHQTGFPLDEVELIVAHVPGVDATEDVLDSLRGAYPGLDIVRTTFTDAQANAKGFMINESFEHARGDWVVFLDADTLLPPDFFARLAPEMDNASFVVPDGRKMLSRETTAKILLGEIRPWEDWGSLLESAGEFRFREMDGVPIGFCQCVRRSCLDEVKYYEADHFEGADWKFSVEMRERFGEEVRLSGLPVLHLDHGGSKWYGASQHF